MNDCAMWKILIKFPPTFIFTTVFDTLESIFDVLGYKSDDKAYICDTNQCEICKAWSDIITVLAEFRSGFTFFLRYFSDFMVPGTPLWPHISFK